MIQQFAKLSLQSQSYVMTQLGDSEMPSQLAKSLDIVKIDCLVLENFKSFDKQYIGPFLGFTCIIGPNGSGKSNILDALMFCFCSEASRHSLLDVRELINRQNRQTFRDLSKLSKVCTVEVIFIVEDGSKLTVSRSLDCDSEEIYKINHQPVSKKLYQNFLLRKGINSSTPNYAIWQGQIDRLVLKQPSQLTTLFQHLSGSIFFKKSYEDTASQIEQIQLQYQHKIREINKLKQSKKNARNNKRTNQQHQKWQQNYNQIVKKEYYVRVLEKEVEIESVREELEKMREKEGDKIAEINQLKIQAQRNYQLRNSYQKEGHELTNKLAELHDRLKKADSPSNILQLQQLTQLKLRLQSQQQQLEAMQSKKQQLQTSIPELPSSQLIKQYLQIYEEWQSQNTSLNRQAIKRNNQLLYLDGLLQNKKELLADFDTKIDRYRQAKEAKKRRIADAKETIAKFEESINKMKSQFSKQKSQIDRGQLELQTKRVQSQSINQNIDELESLITEHACNKQQAELLKHLSTIDNFHGSLSDKIRATTAKYQVCFSVMFAGVKKHLLCQNEGSCREVGNLLKQLNQMRTVVILDNVASNNDNEVRKALGKLGNMAIDIVEHDTNVKGLKQYLKEYLWGKVVCDNIKDAFKIRDKDIHSITQIYTLDGNIVRKDGTISTHGDPQALKKLNKYRLNQSNIYKDLSKLNKQKIKVQAQLANLQIKYDNAHITNKNKQIDMMHNKKQEMMDALKLMEESEQFEPKPPRNLIKEINQLQMQREKVERACEEIGTMIKSSKLFDKFMKRNGIESLEQFRNSSDVEEVEKVMRKKCEINKQISLLHFEINRLSESVGRNTRKLEKMQRNIDDVPKINEKPQIEQHIAEKQKQLIQVRTQLSKLPQINRQQLFLKSAVPALQARLEYLRHKTRQQLQDIAFEYGVEYEYPIEMNELKKQLDFPKKRALQATDIEQLMAKLEKQRKTIEDNLDKHNTIRMLTKFDDEDMDKIDNKISQLTSDVEGLIQIRKIRSEQLQSYRRDRAALLVQFIDSLRGNIEVSYKILTEQENGLSGTVNLHIENNQYPFDHGIYFSPTPPTKRFVYDLEQLSGGEKTIASLALQYSLAINTKVPFMILDETDAFLDARNVDKFLKLINHSMNFKKLQIIVVTHKQGLFSHCESLVGVSRPKLSNLSQVYSLRLKDEHQN